MDDYEWYAGRDTNGHVGKICDFLCEYTLFWAKKACDARQDLFSK